MCPFVSGASQGNNKADTFAGSLRAQRESLGSCPDLPLEPSYLHESATIKSLSATTFIRDHVPGHSYSSEAILLVICPGLRQKTSMKTVASMMIIAERHDPCDSRIQLCCQIIPHSKCYNTPTSTRAIMDSGEYLCMTIPPIKRCDLGGYEKITMFKS